jgi:hypothetical protein
MSATTKIMVLGVEAMRTSIVYCFVCVRDSVSRSILYNHGSSLCYSRCAGQKQNKNKKIKIMKIKEIIASGLSASPDCWIVPISTGRGGLRCVCNTLTCPLIFIN